MEGSLVTADRPRRNNVPQTGLSSDGTASLNASDPENPIVIEDENESFSSHEQSDSDADYQPSKPRASTASKAKSRKPQPEDLDHSELIECYYRLEASKRSIEENLKEVRQKRAADRKYGTEQKAIRIDLQQHQRFLNAKLKDMEQRFLQQEQDHKSSIQILRDNFAHAEKDWLAKIDRQTYPCLPDNVLSNRFLDLMNRCKDWARQNLTVDHLTCPEMKLPHLVRRYCLPGNEILRQKLTEKFQTDRELAVRILGSAWLTRWVLGHFFRTPFALFEGSKRSGLEEAYGDFRTVNARKAHVWRAETLRIFREHIGVSPLEVRAEQVKSDVLKSICTGKAHHLFNIVSPTKVDQNLSTEAQKSLAELQSICLEAALLLLELCCQKSTFSIVDKTTIFSEAFLVQSSLCEAHTSMGLEDDDHSLDGQTVQMILVPAIVVWGNRNGDYLATGKVISRASILIDRDLLSDAPLLQQTTEMVAKTKLHHPRGQALSNLDKSRKRKPSSEDPCGSTHKRTTPNHSGD